MRINRVRADDLIHSVGSRVTRTPWGNTVCECSRFVRAWRFGIPAAIAAATLARKRSNV